MRRLDWLMVEDVRAFNDGNHGLETGNLRKVRGIRNTQRIAARDCASGGRQSALKTKPATQTQIQMTIISLILFTSLRGGPHLVHYPQGRKIHGGRLLPRRPLTDFPYHRRFAAADQPIHRADGRSQRSRLRPRPECDGMGGRGGRGSRADGDLFPATLPQDGNYHRPAVP